MRALQTIACSLVLAAAGAAAADSKTGKGSGEIDISEYRKDMVVLHDGKGHYVIAVPVAKHYSTLFYGNGKNFYHQRTFGGSLSESDKSMSARFWDPRVNHRADVEQRAGTWSVVCGKRTTALEPLPAADASKLIGNASFLPPPWKHEAYRLARDDRGTYYYVDRLREEHGGKGFRLWIGTRGNMKLTKLTNIVSDSEGDIFSTPTGEFRFITSQNASVWIRGKKRSELTNVPVIDNLPLVYADLGVYYGELGTPCDHL